MTLVVGIRRGLVSIAQRWLRWLIHVVPPANGIVVAGWPDTEENAIRVTRSLAEDFGRNVVVLVDDASEARRYYEIACGASPPPNVRYQMRRGPGALWSFVRARHVFYTHGLFGSPMPRRGRVHVNLWHGHGPKRTVELPGRRRPPTPYLVANTHTWGVPAADAQRIQADRLVISRHPRQDAFDEPTNRQALERLGVDPTAALVLWMPTYRVARGVAERAGWCDVASATDPNAFIEDACGAITAADLSGTELVLKSHPLALGGCMGSGVHCISSDDHWRAGISTYQLLAMADALISDYSSVWVEYLEFDRPLALYCPDLDGYERGRGFKTPTLPEVAGGLLMKTSTELGRFINEVSKDEDSLARERAATRERLGLAAAGSTRLLLLELGLGAT